jgi:hypothetical protein
MHTVPPLKKDEPLILYSDIIAVYYANQKAF